MENQQSKIKPILVTGASGHTGSRLVASLVKQGYPVRILTREPARMTIDMRRQVEVVRGNLLDPETAQQAVEGCRAVMSVTHIKFAPAIVAAMQKTGISRGIFMSSTRRFTRFVEETARQVIAGEDTVESSGLKWTIIRPTMIYGGPQDKNLEPLLEILKKYPVFPLPAGGKMLWQPVFTWDVVAAMIAAFERAVSIGKSYTVAGPEPITYRQMLETMIHEAGLKTRLVSVPLGAVRPLVATYEKFVRHPRVQMDQVRRLEENKDFDISEAVSDLGFNPVSFQDGLRRKLRNDA